MGFMDNYTFNGFGSQSSGLGSGNAFNMNWDTSQYTLPTTSGTSTANSNNSLFSQDSFFGNNNQMGWGTGAFSMANAAMNTWLGMKQLDLSEDALNFQMDAWNEQYEANRTLTNASLRDRQAARVSANSSAYQSVDEYMADNAV